MTRKRTLHTTRRVAAALVAVAAGVICAGPGTASAAYVDVNGPVNDRHLVFWGDSGEANKVEISQLGPAKIRVDDVHAIDLSPGGDYSCDHPFLLDGTVVDCVFIYDRSVYLGDGNDTLAPGAGSDSVVGGTGFDRVLYADRTEPVTVLLDDEFNDGAPGEEDNVYADVEGVTGGTGDDTIVDLAGKANGFDGGPGNDLIGGGQGWDATLMGGSGDDTVYGGSGKDMLWGEAGEDRIDGGPDEDIVDAGPDQDRVTSSDGVPESVFCGAGTDRIHADPLDQLTGCERHG